MFIIHPERESPRLSHPHREGRRTHIDTAVDLLVADERLWGDVGGGPAAVEGEAAAGVVILHPAGGTWRERGAAL